MDTGDQRLAAIVVADVVGYSRMMAEDEAGTLSALRAHRNVIDPVILNHGGRVVKTMGDGLLVEFPSATSAVEASVEVQDLMRDRNEQLPESRRMQFRVGINLGDVVSDETGDIFGDGVNVAARLESLADPGGVAVSDAVSRAVSGKTDVELTDAGEHDLKNIPRPVRVWKIGSPPPRSTQRDAQPKRVLATVAVLPFDNMSGDVEQEYFVDGITEDLITALSYDKSLGVVARNSTFAYKGTPKDVRTIARELDATHVVEGSARKAGSRLRVSAQLIDAETGHHIWAERFDRHLADVFEVQDELVSAIVTRLTPSLWESAGRHRADASSIDAWDLTIQGDFEINKFTREGLLAGIELLDQARRLEPDFAPAIARSAMAWMALHFLGWHHENLNAWERGQADAEAAHRLDKTDYRALSALAMARNVAGRPLVGMELARRMIELNPHAGHGFHWLGLGLSGVGRHNEAIDSYTEAWRLGRHEPWHFDTAVDLAYSHYLSGNYEASVEWGRQSLKLQDDYLQAHIGLAAAYAQLDRATETQPHVDAVMSARPEFTLTRYRSHIVYTREEDRDHIVDGLTKAGLPK